MSGVWAENNQGPKYSRPSKCLKEFTQRPGSRIEQSVEETSAENMGRGWKAEQSLEIRVHSVSPCIYRAQPTFLYQTFAWPSLGQLPSHPFWSPKPLPPTSSFVFNWRWYLRWGFHPFGELLILPGSLPCICLIKLLCVFLIFISFISVEFLGQPEEPRRIEGNLPLQHLCGKTAQPSSEETLTHVHWRQPGKSILLFLLEKK